MSVKSLSLSLGLTLAVLAGAPALMAQVAPPIVNRPKNFSNVVGSYRISYSARPTEVQVEDPITVTVLITGKGPKEYQPRLRNLHLFSDEAAEKFYIEPVADESRILPGRNGETIWEFVYRLRPKTTNVTQVPEPSLVYYDPSQSQSFVTESPDPDAEAITLTVKPRHDFTKDNLPAVVGAPERLYHLVTGESVLARDSVQPLGTPGILIGVIVGVPLVCVLGFIVGRRLFPNGARQQQRRRSLAARRALRALTQLKPCSPQQAVKILTTYLSQRLDLPTVEPTPVEVAQLLRRRGIAGALRDRWADFFRGCDEVRFTPSEQQEVDTTWPSRAVDLIQALEADPCLASPRP